VAELLVQFADPVHDGGGRFYTARACGSEMGDGLWQGWIEFISADGTEVLRSGRETTQPNRTDTEYWATGLTNVYLEGALDRARKPIRIAIEPEPAPPVFDGPAEIEEELLPATTPESILNPFSVYRKGEALLRGQLAAISPWHLVNIIRAHGLSDEPPSRLNLMSGAELIEIIVSGVRRQLTAIE
jgi:hypothetical protein